MDKVFDIFYLILQTGKLQMYYKKVIGHEEENSIQSRL